MFKLLAMLVLAACTTAIAAPDKEIDVRSNTSKEAATQQQGRAETEALSPIVQALLEQKPEKKETKQDNK
ncbi:hypothetical protein [Pseudomonas sp. MF6747]|uniref:hypothetical protein n=1 Tax=Pseudomonas sp. MF6747 TaxID=2797527 RepID=UPI00190DB495|nr:hypothetical protein [Pseudomonas sp. MF6747]MBK3506632.1 hypothetical protein [Pseudomonas sp. MF6747]